MDIKKTKIIDFSDYLNAQKYASKATQQISAMVAHIQPKIEDLLDSEIAKMSMSSEIYTVLKNDSDFRNHLDLTVVTSLCYLLAQYLISISQRDNTFDVDEDNLELFVVNLMRGMLQTFEKKKDK